MKKETKTYVGIAIFIILLFGLFIAINHYVIQPYKHTQELEQNVTELTEFIEENRTITVTEEGEEVKNNNWIFAIIIIILIIVIIVLVLTKQSKGVEDAKHNMEEIIDFLRGTPDKQFLNAYSKKRLYGRYYFSYGWYVDKPLALVTFSTLKTWGEEVEHSNTEPKKAYHYGFLINMNNLKDIQGIYPGWTLKEMKKEIYKTRIGMEFMQLDKTDKPTIEQIALIEHMKESGNIEKKAKELLPMFELMKE
ncbi:hypothetical protein K8R33_02805 [archaeon]|nr:hypothetical protein [archaeon]